jgi:hypothetical protein
MDLSPIVIEVIPGSQRHLRFRGGPVSFPVELDEQGHLLVVRDANLDIHVFGESRADLASELADQIELMWIEYAEADPSLLTAGAASLREKLRERLTLLGDGS